MLGKSSLLVSFKEFIDHPQLDQMILGPYVNYVTQAALNHSKEDMDSEIWLRQGSYFLRATQVCWNSSSLAGSHQNFE